MVPVRVVGHKGIFQGTYCTSGFDGRLSPRLEGQWRRSRHTSVATAPRFTRPTKGQHKGNRFHPTRLITLAADGMGDTAKNDDLAEETPIVRPATFELYKYDSMNGLFTLRTLTRLIYPYDVENQKESVICQGGDYTYMRNTEPITDEQPNFPSVMFLAKEDRSKAEAEYTDVIYTVGQKNDVYRGQFRHGSLFNPIPTVRPPRVFGVGLPLFYSFHTEFSNCSIKQYDFVGASTTGNQPPLLPSIPGRGGYDTDGAMFASRIIGSRGGLVGVYPTPEIIIATYQPDNVSQGRQTSFLGDRLAAFRWRLGHGVQNVFLGRVIVPGTQSFEQYFCLIQKESLCLELNPTVNEVMSSEEMDVVAIVYDPDEPFTEQEQACVKELFEPKACAVVFLIPKDEPADMATDQRYAVMRALQDAGALVVSSVDGDYLRTPLTEAAWGRFDYNVVVGDTEAPGRGSKDKYQLVEGTSITAAAAGCAACIAVLLVMRPRRASPRIVKQILSAAAVDLKEVLKPKTVADLEAYRDQCIADCGLSTQKSSPQCQSMLNGLAVDARILRFGKDELESAFKRVFADALVALADIAASTGVQLAPAKQLWLTLEETRTIDDLKFDIKPDLAVSDADFRAWARLIEAAGNRKEYSELSETAGALAGLIPFQNVGFCVAEFAAAICEARKIITARGPVREDMQWVLGVSETSAPPVGQKKNPDSLKGDGSPYAIRGSEDIEDFRKQIDRQVEEQAIRASEEIEDFRKWLQKQVKPRRRRPRPWRRSRMDTSRGTVQGGQSDSVGGSKGKEVPDEVQGPPKSELSADQQLGAPGQEGPAAGEPQSLGGNVEGSKEQVASDKRGDSGSASCAEDGQDGATDEVLGGDRERSWAGLLQYFVDLLTGKLGGKEGQGKQADIDEDGRLSNMMGVGVKRTWVGLIEYFNYLLMKTFNI